MTQPQFSYAKKDELIRKVLACGPASVPTPIALELISWIEHYGQMVDKLLNHCPIGECEECSKIVCPYGEPLHLHHDGCPCCAMEVESEASV